MENSPELKPYVDRAKASSLLKTIVPKLGRPMKTEGEIRPTDIAPVIAPSRKSQSPAVFPMAWGFTNPRSDSGSPLVNARSETASQKPFWKESWTRRRCVIPASYYFEWEHCTASDGKKKTAQKYMIQPKDSAVTFLAGLYGFEERNGITVPVFTILTREPGEGIRFIHDRMPVVLPGDAARAWCNPGNIPEEIIGSAITDMFYEKAEL
jgi:putative SOS response-associated peptidase YedK